ncbi:MAG: ParA family protein [Acidobacteria bacterium]|nr:ParA family protein [Acidobacteriota bacterium]
MGRVIAIANQKGGVGKTTTAVNLAASLSKSGLRVLLIDFDPQANASSGLGIRQRGGLKTIYQVLIGNEDISNVVMPTSIENLSLVPSEKNLAGADVEILELENREFRLRNAISGILPHFDFILIDCPPSLGVLTINALAAAQSVLVPVQCEYYALEGVTELLDTLDRVRRSINAGLRVEGFLLTMHDERLNLSNQVAEDLKSYLGRDLFNTVIHRSVRLAEAPSHGKPIIAYDPASRGSIAYLNLAEEVKSHDA